ncbi:MAG TPA: bifunctional glutamate N-acetyltransferase/amino-acid acetyltransferase ArgJ [Candidatus Limnocylindria bacterium]|jgi:glutamate N-acetyltransferase/amino-acid N-acetyltransferase|nr:bifunctional glutamate N-acetyltransferase/amino-acid acetyltransferase ArgJ [Candidatus Limnocylindria bacterium]
MTHDVTGFTAGAAAAGVRDGKPSRTDVALIVSDRPCAAAGVFTTNQVIAAPCVVTRRHLEQGRLRAIVVNSGNANACTGEQGERHAVTMARAAAQRVGCDPYEVAVASTGVIGVPLPVERITKAVKAMGLRPAAWGDVANAIMTTDTKPKLVGVEAPLSGGVVHLRGVAKGAGMIHPNMATMLAFVMTDADIEVDDLRSVVRVAADASFNAISIDGDTSTNDTLLVLANGASGVKVRGDEVKEFGAILDGLCERLAREILADGEGVTRVFDVAVTGAAASGDAKLAARTITTSNLVKTAIHGADPNWGRILAAAGRSGARVDQTRASVRIGHVAVYESGSPVPFDADEVRRLFEQKEISIHVDLGLGTGAARAWGTDLSAEYVRINAEYTT